MNADARDGEIRRTRRVVQRVLRVGLGVAVALMAAGLGLRLVAGDLQAEGVALPRLFAGRHPGDALMALGILVLAMVPPLRVASLLTLWTQERDRLFAGVAFAVLTVLLLAILAGGG